jgi:hypothetical protein
MDHFDERVDFCVGTLNLCNRTVEHCMLMVQWIILMGQWRIVIGYRILAHYHVTMGNFEWTVKFCNVIVENFVGQ